MTWIRTVPPEADPLVARTLERLRAMYPVEYAEPVHASSVDAGVPAIIASHTLIPGALEHAFSTFGALMSADLPLTRAQHEMIATVVSAVNVCGY